jgi:hypothetical protein
LAEQLPPERTIYLSLFRGRHFLSLETSQECRISVLNFLDKCLGKCAGERPESYLV